MVDQREPHALLDRIVVDGFSVETIYPRKSGRWPVRFVARDGSIAFGSYDPETGAAAVVSPTDDAALPHLAEVAARGRLIAHRVGQRAVVEITAPTDRRFVKILPQKKVQKAVQALNAAAAAEAAGGPRFPRVPRLLAFDEEAGTIELSVVDGQSFHDELRGRLGEARFPSLAAALVRWQKARGPERPIEEPFGELSQFLSFAKKDGADAAVWDDVLDRLRDRFIVSGDLERCLLHGDLHDKNVLFSDSEGIGFIDVDGIRDGFVGEDAGNLAAHIVLRSLQRGASQLDAVAESHRFLEAWASACGRFSRSTVHGAAARTLFRLACLYRLRRSGRGITDALLSAADAWEITE